MLTSFKAGIGVVLFVGQLGKVLGIPVAKGPFFQTILSLQRLGGLHWLTLVLGLVTLALLIGLPRLAPLRPIDLYAAIITILSII